MAENDDSMAKEDRARLILEYLADNEVALPPRRLHDNLKLYRNITFSYDTVRRRLHDFEHVGLVEKIDMGPGLFRITDEGRRALREDLSDEELKELIGIADE